MATDLRLLLFLLWFLFIASASFWLPAYNGDIGDGDATFVAVYALVAGAAAVGVRGRARSAGHALLSALPVLALLAAAAVGGNLRNDQQAQFPGEPIYLYFGVALWASWAALVLSTALVSQTSGMGSGESVSDSLLRCSACSCSRWGSTSQAVASSVRGCTCPSHLRTRFRGHRYEIIGLLLTDPRDAPASGCWPQSSGTRCASP
jgi:hypothetical protein